MEETEAIRLRRVLSQARLGEYAAVCGGDPVMALRLFCWNTEVAGALYGPLQHLELALRSVVDQQMRQLLGRADWWDAPEANLHFAAQQKINDARGQLRRQAIPNTPEEVVNELPFGFWVGLLGSGNRYDQRFWRTTLHRAFPHYRGRRRDLHQQLDYLRVLRNKIAHHGPIHHRHLQADHETVVEVLGYIDLGLADLVRRYSPVGAVLNRRPPTP
ncbi:Abi family protein [Sphaerisporangium flaviroseum]|uniref:Abi family protein n=1 Tax=Sphaerisporangium flaviroseum TaxID=509199 RepID=A0ABP7JI46_9ACTN